jgi:hypothetical protein
MKKEKLTSILKSYKTIKFSYIARRLALSENQVERMVFQLIADHKIYAKINDAGPNNSYLEIIEPPNQFL